MHIHTVTRSMQNIFHHKYSTPAWIFLIIFACYLPFLYIDTLWHDDGLWYFWATGGQNEHIMERWNLLNGIQGQEDRVSISILIHYYDLVYSYGMVYFGPPFTRAIFVLILASCSLALYFLYRDAFGINAKVAVAAAIIPSILPSLKGVPIGLNASYAMWGMLPILISLLFILKSFKTNSLDSVVLICLAFVFYVVGLNFAVAANFFIPSVLLFFAAFFYTEKIKSIQYSVPFLIYGLWQVYKQHLYTHRKPIILPATEIMDRIWQFIEMSAFLPFEYKNSGYIVVGLMLLGVLSIFFLDSILYRQPAHFKYSQNMYRVLLLAWPLCWMIANGIVYVSMSDEFRVVDYAYVFNYGAVLLQILGLIFISLVLSRQLTSCTPVNMNAIISGVIVCAIIFTGVQKLKSRDNSWYLSLERNYSIVRNNLSNYCFPEGSQIVILGLAIPHVGHILYNSGAIRYILNRKDLYAVMGQPKYPNDIFSEPYNYFDVMNGFKKEKPVFAFRNKDSTFERVPFLLQVNSTGEKALPRLQWNLYDISTHEPPKQVAAGKGIESYYEYVNNNKLEPSNIAFSPDKSQQEEFIEESTAAQINIADNLLEDAINFGAHFTLKNVSVVTADNGLSLQLLIKINSLPDEPFKLGYRLNNNGNFNALNLWKFAFAGDNILITLPIGSTTNEMSLELKNVDGWYHKPLIIQGGKYNATSALNISSLKMLNAICFNTQKAININSTATACHYILTTGWNGLEAWGIWSTANPEMQIDLPKDCQGNAECELKLNFTRVFNATAAKPKEVIIKINGQLIEKKLIGEQKTINIPLNSKTLQGKFTNIKIQFSIPDAESPGQINRDTRILGISLISYQFIKRNAN